MGLSIQQKSTLLAVVAGVLSPQEGYVEIDGLRRRSSVEAELAIRKKTVYLPDQPWLPLQRTGREYLLAIGNLYEIEAERLFDHFERLLLLFDLTSQSDALIGSYSTGQKKKIAICGTLVTEAKILLLDEPFSGGLDPSALLALKRVLQWLAQRPDITIALTTPVPEILEEIADRLAVLRDGRIIALDTVSGIRQLASGASTLAEGLERLINPRTLQNLEHYFKRSS